MSNPDVKGTSAYRSDAQKVFNDMKNYFSYPEGNMWTYGNAFDSMADFMMLTSQGDADFLAEVYSSFQLPGAWYDDFCWPAIAALKAYDPAYATVFSGTSTKYNESYASLFQKYVIANWQVVHNGQPPSQVHALGTQNVWNKINQTTWAAYAPRFLGGAWQCDINADLNSQDLEAQNPGTNSLGPFQDTVMNDLLLVFSTRLSALTSESNISTEVTQATTASESEIGFLLNWFNRGTSSDKVAFGDLLLKFSSEEAYKSNDYSDGVLVRERVGTYAEQDGAYPALNYYDPNRAWGGDQGLMLGGLIDQDSSVCTDIAVGIIKGVKNNMYYTQPDGKHWLFSLIDPSGWPGKMCPSCYNAGGGGIFMRNLLYALRTGNEEVVTLMKTQEYVDFVTNLANTAVDGPAPEAGQNYQFVNLTRLAALNVAIYYEETLGIKLTKA